MRSIILLEIVVSERSCQILLDVVLGLNLSLRCCNAKVLENNFVHKSLELENCSLIMFEKLVEGLGKKIPSNVNNIEMKTTAIIILWRQSHHRISSLKTQFEVEVRFQTLKVDPSIVQSNVSF